MTALSCYVPEAVRLEEGQDPQCGPEEVELLIRNRSTCGTGIGICDIGHQNLNPPLIIGDTEEP